MIEYGVFTDEGCIESGLYSEEDAARAAEGYRLLGEACDVLPLCPDHEEQSAVCCEDCNSEEDE